MRRFRSDNTEGYSISDLSALNTAWDQIMSHGGYAQDNPDDFAAMSYLDHCAEQLLGSYDAGNRGDDLVAWYYDP